jgi:hypothetical protein
MIFEFEISAKLDDTSKPKVPFGKVLVIKLLHEISVFVLADGNG